MSVNTLFRPHTGPPGQRRLPRSAGAVAPPRADDGRVRLLKFSTDFVFGGTERQFLALSVRLDPAVFDKYLACFWRGGRFLAQADRTGLPLLEFSIDRLYGLRTMAAQMRFLRELRRLRIDIVHAYGFYPNVFAVGAARLAGAVAIGSVRDQGDIWTPLQRRVQRLMLAAADAVVVNAEAVKRRLVREGYADSKVVVIHNGVDLARFAPRRPAGRLHHRLGVAPDAPLVAAVCRLHAVKGLGDLLEAAAILSPRFPKARFVIAGDGLEAASLRDHAERLGLRDRVCFTGYCEDVAELLSEAHVSVLPSHSEALPNVVLESMAVGVPVVATAIGGMSEAVDDGETGLLVPPRAPLPLARAIGWMLENPSRAEAMGRAGRRRAERYFSLERLTADTQRLYLDLLSRRRRH